jgi:hypothetical protein
MGWGGAGEEHIATPPRSLRERPSPSRPLQGRVEEPRRATIAL